MSPSPIDSSRALNASTPEAASKGPGLGAQLRKARERRGLTQAELGSRLNLTAGTIDALEREDLLALPGPVYVRGYLRRLAAELELDEAELQQAYSHIAGEITPAPRRPAPRTEPMRAPRQVRRFPLLLLVIVGVAFVVAGLLAQRYLPGRWLATDGTVAPQEPTSGAPAPTPVAPVETLPLPPPSLPSDAGQAPAPRAAAATPAAGEPRAPEPSAQTANSAPTPSAPAPSAPATSEPATASDSTPRSSIAVLELRAGKAESWVQVKDATGKLLLEEVLKPGSTRRVQGTRPLRVMVGNAAATSLALDGQAVDLSPYIRPSGTAFIASLGG